MRTHTHKLYRHLNVLLLLSLPCHSPGMCYCRLDCIHMAVCVRLCVCGLILRISRITLAICCMDGWMEGGREGGREEWKTNIPQEKLITEQKVLGLRHTHTHTHTTPMFLSVSQADTHTALLLHIFSEGWVIPVLCNLYHHKNNHCVIGQ